LLIKSYRNYIAHLDGVTNIAGGWLNHHWVQLGYQIADSVAGGLYSFTGTCLILACLEFLGNYLPALKLRVSEQDEVMGIDDAEIGEFAVGVHLPYAPRTALTIRSMITSNSPAKSKPPMTISSDKKKLMSRPLLSRMRRFMILPVITHLPSS